MKQKIILFIICAVLSLKLSAQTTSLCIGGNATISCYTSLIATGGTWSSSDAGVAAVDASGNVTGVSAGTATISYNVSSICGAAVFTTPVVVNASPDPITGTTSVCVGNTTALSDATSGGTWSSNNAGIAAVNSSGVVSGVSAGTTTITYAAPVTGCYVTTSVTVNPLPASISGTTSVCVGATTNLSDASTGGTWSTSNAGIADVNTSTGVVSGISAGTATITYTLPTGCFITTGVTVNALPTVLPITGTLTVCVGAVTTLADATPSGTWSSLAPGTAAVNSSGVVTGVTAGSTTISYTVSNAYCSASATATVIVVAPFSISITQTSPITITGDNVHVYCTSGGNPFTLTVTGSPALPSTGVTYTWHPSSGSNLTTESISPTLSANTFYTVTAVYGCTATVKDTVLVPADSACSPCAAFVTCSTGGVAAVLQPFHTIGGVSSGTYNVSAAMMAPTDGVNNFYIHSSVNMNGTIDMTDKVILMNTNKAINVTVGADISFHHSHLFSACSNWKGIAVANTSGGFGILKVDDNSLIEKADIAISLNTGSSTTAPGANAAYLVSATDNIFNNNEVGISLKYNPDVAITPAPSEVMPFIIYGNTFTGRDFSCYNDGTTTYPFVWRTSAYLQTVVTPDHYHPTLNIDAFTATTTINSGTTPNTGFAKTGIELLGSKTVSGTPNTYYKFRIGAQDGSGTFGGKLFDRLADNGVTSVCNFEMQNNIFRDIQPYNSSGNTAAIYASASGINQALLNNGTASAGTVGNSIYNCWDRVSGSAVYLKSFANLTMVHSSLAQDSTLGHHTGVTVTGSNYDTLTYKFNNTADYYTGISLTVNSAATTNNGFIYVDSNIFSSTYWDGTWLGPVDGSGNLIVGRKDLGTAIDIRDAKTGGPYNEYGSVYVTGNKIYEAIFYAMYIKDFNQMPVYMDHNYLRLYDRTGVSSFGFRITNMKKVDATNNTIRGRDGAFTSTGIYYSDVLDADSISNITCNHTNQLYRDFAFGNDNVVNWRDNTMDTSMYGLYLSTGGSIGQQGSPGDPIDNYWINTNNWWTVGVAAGTAVKETFALNNGSAAASILYVRNIPVENYPNSTARNGGSTSARYTAGTTIITTTGGDLPSCTEQTLPSGRAFNGNSVSDLADGQGYTITPNPTDGRITIKQQICRDETINIQVVNATGKVVYNSKTAFSNCNAKLEINNVVPGLYQVVLVDESGHRFTEKLIIQK